MYPSFSRLSFEDNLKSTLHILLYQSLKMQLSVEVSLFLEVDQLKVYMMSLYFFLLNLEIDIICTKQNGFC